MFTSALTLVIGLFLMITAAWLLLMITMACIGIDGQACRSVEASQSDVLLVPPRNRKGKKKE
jgi:hypothetical protein